MKDLRPHWLLTCKDRAARVGTLPEQKIPFATTRVISTTKYEQSYVNKSTRRRYPRMLTVWRWSISYSCWEGDILWLPETESTTRSKWIQEGKKFNITTTTTRWRRFFKRSWPNAKVSTWPRNIILWRRGDWTASLSQRRNGRTRRESSMQSRSSYL